MDMVGIMACEGRPLNEYKIVDSYELFKWRIGLCSGLETSIGEEIVLYTGGGGDIGYWMDSKSQNVLNPFCNVMFSCNGIYLPTCS